jgi:hypothetical protein
MLASSAQRTGEEFLFRIMGRSLMYVLRKQMVQRWIPVGHPWRLYPNLKKYFEHYLSVLLLADVCLVNKILLDHTFDL